VALVSDAHTAEIAYTPYQRPPERQAIKTAIPRGLKTFIVRKAVLALKPVNDTELLSVNFTLPSGFGYVLADVHLNIVQDKALDWGASGYLLLTNIDPAHDDMDYKMPILFVAVSNGGVTVDARMTQIPAGTLSRVPISPGRGGSLTSLRFNNLAAAAAAAGVVNAVCSFWEYDLEQLSYYPAHSALNVVGR